MKFKGTVEPEHNNLEYDKFWVYWAKNRHYQNEFAKMHNMCLYYFLKGLRLRK